MRNFQLHVNNSMVYGDYKCKAWNKLGVLEKFISLKEGVQPDPPDLIMLKHVTSHSIDLEIRGPDLSNKTIPTGMEPLGYRIQYKEFGEDPKRTPANIVDVPMQNGLCNCLLIFCWFVPKKEKM